MTQDLYTHTIGNPDGGHHGIKVRLPQTAEKLPLVIFIHGGFWKRRWTYKLMEPLFKDLMDLKFILANVEYASVSDGNTGVWRQTLCDIEWAYKQLTLNSSEITEFVDDGRIAIVGHSAGGQLALWLAGKTVEDEELPSPALTVAQAAVTDLTKAAQMKLSDDGDAVQRWLGGTVGESSGYLEACPTRFDSFPGELLFAHCYGDKDVPLEFSNDFSNLIGGKGISNSSVLTPGDHYSVIDPTHDSWKSQKVAIRRVVGF